MVFYPHVGTSTLSEPASRSNLEAQGPGCIRDRAPIAQHFCLVGLGHLEAAHHRPSSQNPPIAFQLRGTIFDPMINTSKDPNSTPRPSFQAPSSQPRSITQRSRLARLGNPRDTGGPAPKRLTWPDHGDRNRSLGTLRRTRTTGANLPLPLASAPSCSKHPGTHNHSTGIELPILAAPWSDKVTRISRPDPETTPDSLPRVISAAGVVVLLYYCFKDRRGILVAQGRTQRSRGPSRSKARNRSRSSWWRTIPGGEAKFLGLR